MIHVVSKLSDSPCRTCGQLYGSTCCSTKAGGGARLPMTYGDAQRVSRWANKPGINGVAVMSADVDEVSRRLGPDFAQLVVAGRGLYLPLQTNGDCVYLGNRGCTIPNAKPTTCAMFPFRPAMNTPPSLAFVGAPGYCYGQDIGQDEHDVVMQIFGETHKSLNDKTEQWRKDIKQHRPLLASHLKKADAR